VSAIYPNDDFLLHKLCMSNPWNGTNFKGDATSSFPCHYNYSFLHVPTYEAEIKSFKDQIDALQIQISTLQGQVQQPSSTFASLEQMGITPEASLIAFGFSFATVLTFWSIGFVASVVRQAFGLIR